MLSMHNKLVKINDNEIVILIKVALLYLSAKLPAHKLKIRMGINLKKFINPKYIALWYKLKTYQYKVICPIQFPKNKRNVVIKLRND